MHLTARPWIVAALLGFLGLMPTPAHAGMTAEEVKEFERYKAAAEQGYAMAQFNLGACYTHGQGVAKDEIEAYANWNLAGITVEVARKNLAILEKKMPLGAYQLGQKRTKELQKEIEAKMARK